jgi:hypothetical protein
MGLALIVPDDFTGTANPRGEIIGQRLDLTRTQAFVAIVIAVFTGIAAFGTVVQAGVTYHDWACRSGWHSVVACPKL